MESESGTNNTKISDSGYSNSCSNTASQGSASSKSRHSGGSNSSRSSGYGGAPNANESSESSHVPDPKTTKEHRKSNNQKSSPVPGFTAVPQTFIAPIEGTTGENSPARASLGVESAPPSLEAEIQEKLELGENKSEPPLVDVPLIQDDNESPGITNEKTEFFDSFVNPEEPPKNDFDDDFLGRDLLASSQSEVNDGFCCVISMYDGIVLYTTPNLTSILGFPQDTWLGHSFIDFVHPKDRDTFSSQVSTNAGMPLVDSQGKDVRNCLYVCLRRHESSSGKSIPYQAFNLTVTIKQMGDSGSSGIADKNAGLLLLIIAVPVYSAYKAPRERKMSTKFGMRHTPTCILSYVDPDVVTNFGFLPQDMLGKSIFDFYHPEDMPFLKEVYRSVMKRCQISGSVFRSKPYRFLVQNGCFAMIETEWSSVINPWSRRLEFVISLHQVLQGPLNPNVFDTATDKELKTIPCEAINHGKVLQAEIRQLLTMELPKPMEISKQGVSKRCKDLAKFTETFINNYKLEMDVAQDFNHSFSERDSVMLGEISPHHDFCDSKSSSETPPSYNQLNYNENISRFFQSNPKTFEESNFTTNAPELTDGKKEEERLDFVPPNQLKWLSPLQRSGTSRCSSAGNLSSGSNPTLESRTTPGTMSNDDYKAPQLTASVLVRHNEDMEKIMIQKHKKERSHVKDREAKRSHQKLEKHTNQAFSTNEHNQGVKRSGRHLIDDRACCKLSKHAHEQPRQSRLFEDAGPSFYNNERINISAESPVNPLSRQFLTESPLNMWSPFSVPVAHNPPLAVNQGVVPVYYVPTIVQSRPALSNPQVPERNQMQYLPAGVLSSLFPQPIICPTVPILSLQNVSLGPDGGQLGNIGPSAQTMTHDRSAYLDSVSLSHDAVQQSTQYQHFDSSIQNGSRPMPQCDRPSSQATSVKAEPGSRIGSIASASVVNKALSECSRKDLGLQSICSLDAPLANNPDGEVQAELFNTNAKLPEPIQRSKKPGSSYRRNLMDEDSSCYASSYSSFLKTDTGSRSYDESTSTNNTKRTEDDMVKSQLKVYPLRKRDPPWVESVSLSPDLIYRYQMTVKNIDEILKTDLNALNQLEQPTMVNDQLHQLYIEMELEGLSRALTLEEECLSNSSSSSSSGDYPENSSMATRMRKKQPYSSLVMIYEQDAPFPSPETNS